MTEIQRPIAKFGYSSALVDDLLVHLPHPPKKNTKKKTSQNSELSPEFFFLANFHIVATKKN
jgi:hypothetical protein